MTMTKQRAIKLLENPDFINLMIQRREVRDSHRKLGEARKIMTDNWLGVPEELEKKLVTLKAIKRGYENMIEDVFQLSWHWWSRFEEFIDRMQRDELNFDDLPGHIKP